jgi:antitoxin component of MazEF toxin-antitoxin module
MMQKVVKLGTSAAVTIPKRAMKDLGVKLGDRVHVEVVKNTRTLKVRTPVKVDHELLEWTNAFIDRYRPALKALARK